MKGKNKKRIKGNDIDKTQRKAKVMPEDAENIFDMDDTDIDDVETDDTDIDDVETDDTDDVEMDDTDADDADIDDVGNDDIDADGADIDGGDSDDAEIDDPAMEDGDDGEEQNASEISGDDDSGIDTDESDDDTPKKVRLYEDYVIDDPEDMDEAPDTGDMFDDDDDLESAASRGRRSRQRRCNVYGPAGKTLALLWTIFVVLVCGYIYIFHINTTIFADDITGRDNSVNIEIPAGANYSLCTIDEINQLISNYLLARTNADQTTLKRLVTDPSEFDDMKSIEIAAQYITAYNRTTCYMVPGENAGEYIIYALSNLTIKDVDSEPLDIRSFYVAKQTDGSYKIDNSQLSDDVNEYIQNVTASKYIQDMYQYVKENTDYLLKHDDTFKKFQNMYN